MADMRSVRQGVIEGWRLDRAGSADDFVNRAICSALGDLRPHQFEWNTSRFSMDTIADQETYAVATKGGATANLLPWDFYGVLGHVLWYDDEKTATDIYELEEATVSQYHRTALAQTESGRPEVFVYDSQDRLGGKPSALWLGPQPPDSIDTVHGRYLQGLETPYPKYSGSAWTYIGAAGSAIDEDTFTTAWFTNAFEVLVARTVWRYYTDHDRDATGASAAQTVYDTELGRLKDQRSGRHNVGKFVPFLG